MEEQLVRKLVLRWIRECGERTFMRRFGLNQRTEAEMYADELRAAGYFSVTEPRVEKFRS